ncbi:hypothetical protein LJR166_003688 [Acidovorax delafieldii]
MNCYELSMLDDVIDSTAQAAEQAKRLEKGVCSPKWLVVAAHSAAQAAMTCYLNQGDGMTSWRKKDAQAWQNAYEQQQAQSASFQGYPVVRLNFFMELYADVKETAQMKRDARITSSLSGDMDRWMIELNQLRNSLVHFQANRHVVFKQHVVAVTQAASATVNALSASPSFPWWWSDEAEHASSLLQEHLKTLDSALSTLTTTSTSA